ncbi:MAG: BolA family transcriptional regulator [Candidatus Neomarinimicrobiota bacterium]|jgi:BolA protein|uniref:BolA family transcriptional regulator n=1 Tax=marine metagenome TaxID=408172 RepID=A0A381SZB0_9ZZZZ|nr:BolA family transcriptional regulator [Candidatus Neomarinimicrobiota bacterium]MED5553984.1 BolA family transcriptional regulator [Candidatus Neomarinimicrobiota bacterium]|tara:strand:- start:4541 stop:4813 length:273 start_codon:yes stop_codon:yes gene_type:complete
MDIGNKIEQKLGEQLDLHHIEIKDFTGRHLNHKQHDGGFHLEAIIVSESFINKTLIDRHKIIYAALGELLKHEIHAFSMKTLTPEEWENK